MVIDSAFNEPTEKQFKRVLFHACGLQLNLPRWQRGCFDITGDYKKSVHDPQQHPLSSFPAIDKIAYQPQPLSVQAMIDFLSDFKQLLVWIQVQKKVGHYDIKPDPLGY